MMNKLEKKEFLALTSVCRSAIIDNCIKQANGEETKHSLCDIVKQNRHLAIAARMTSKPLQWYYRTLDTKGNITCSELKAYTGADVAQIFVESVQKNKFCYYPLTGNWKDTGVQQLVLFVKTKGTYMPYARFHIDDIVPNTQMTANQLSTLVDITPALNCKHKSLLKISEVETENLPSNFLGLRSGKDLYEVAFKGSSPNIMMI